MREELLRWEQWHVRGGELDRERQALQSHAELPDRLRRIARGALAEESHALLRSERRQLVRELLRHAEPLTRRDEQGQRRAGGDQLRELLDSRRQVLGVV